MSIPPRVPRFPLLRLLALTALLALVPEMFQAAQEQQDQILLTRATPETARAADSPTETIAALYAAIDAGDCEFAARLWPGYSASRCAATSNVRLLENELLCRGENTAAVRIGITYTRGSGPKAPRENFLGYVTLSKTSRGWIVKNGSHRRAASISRDDYVTKVAGLPSGCVRNIVADQAAPQAPPAQTPAPEPSVQAPPTPVPAPLPESSPLPPAMPAQNEQPEQIEAAAVHPNASAVAAPGQAAEGTSAPGSQRPLARPMLPLWTKPGALPDSDDQADAAQADPAAQYSAGQSAFEAPSPTRPPTRRVLVLPPLPEQTPPAPDQPLTGLSLTQLKPTPLPPPADMSPYYRPGLDFGSQAALEALWSPAELAGKPSERSPDQALPLSQEGRRGPSIRLAPLPPALRAGVLHIAPAGFQKILALTFDASEGEAASTGFDAELVDFLRTNSIKATFFLGGKWMATHPEKAMQLLVDPLFEIGSLAWNSTSLRPLRGAELEQQLLWPLGQYELLRERAIERATRLGVASRECDRIPKLPRVFRFPEAKCAPQALPVLSDLGLPAIFFDVDSEDVNPRQDPPALATRILAQARSGSIIRFHANGRGHYTATAMPLVITLLRKEGCHFVTVSELLTLGRIVAPAQCE